ncbi:MAG: hypothetical protein JWO76_154, partial [Nocardioides sp.]|nr:hypothetical protein [Nocardioides sp.]
PVQQFAYTTGKNSTDSALIIDAMDLLYSGNLDAFAIVSSDSDFTRLATRLRESGKTVIGLGRRRTPASLVAACDRFIFLEVLEQQDAAAAPAPEESADPESAPPLPDLRTILTSAINGTSQDDGWSSLSAVGSYLGTRNASFDPRNYGFPKLTSLARAQDYVELDQSSPQPRVRLRSKREPAGKKTAKATAKKQAAKQATAKTSARTRGQSG